MVDGWWSVVGAVGGVLGGAGAVWAAIAAHGAKGDASRSAAAAEGAAEAAAGSLDVARAERLRAVERTDVKWRRVRVKPENGIVVLENAGTTTAYAVAVMVNTNGQRNHIEPGDVLPGGTVEHDATDIHAAAVRARNETFRAMNSGGVFYAAITKFQVSARITWQSELGTPGRQVIGEDE